MSLMNKIISFCFVLVLVLVLADLSFAQPPPPALPIGPAQAPIDGGLSLLVLGGGAYALKKLRNKSK